MNRIRNTVLALGVFLALPVVRGFAAEQRTLGSAGRISGQVTQGQFQSKGTGTYYPVPTTPVPYSCDNKGCACSNPTDCGRMGQAGVCKAGTFIESGPGGGVCVAKDV